MANVTYNQLMQNYVNASYDVLLSVANESLSKIMPFFGKFADDGNGASIVLPFICTVIAVDGKFSELEHRFVKDVTGISKPYAEFKEFVQQFYSDKWIESTDKLIDSCPDEIRTSLLSFALAFMAVDEKISREENAFISRLMA